MKVWAETDPGCVRCSNEDALFCGEIDGSDAVVLAVADGMGGHEGGEIASHLAVESISAGLARPDGGWEQRLRSSFARAHALILSRDGSDGSRPMGTTMTCAVVDGCRVTIGHVGDSRAYVCTDGQVRRLTDDHSLVGEIERTEGLSEREAMVHPHRHILTRALGVSDHPQPDIVEIDVSDGDVLVLCTDGLTSVVTSEEIGALAGATSDQPALRLVELANARGGPDNITVIVAAVDGQAAIEVMPR